MGTGSKKKLNMKVSEDVLTKMWNGVRLNNGIMVLLKLLAAKTPITDADSLRALACKVSEDRINPIIHSRGIAFYGIK